MLQRRWNGLPLAAALATALLAGCDDPVGPSVDDVAGVYHAVDFRFREDGVTSGNLVDEGVTVDLTLHADGTSSGSMFVPGEDVIDLEGTWDIDGSDVDIDVDANPYVQEISFDWRSDGTLRAEESYFGRGVIMILARADATSP